MSCQDSRPLGIYTPADLSANQSGAGAEFLRNATLLAALWRIAEIRWAHLLERRSSPPSPRREGNGSSGAGAPCDISDLLRGEKMDRDRRAYQPSRGRGPTFCLSWG